MAKDLPPPPSGYDVPPDLDGQGDKAEVPVPSGYDVPDLGESVPSPTSAIDTGPGTPGVNHGPPVSSGNFTMKSMEQEYIDGEKNQQGRSVDVGGQAVDVRDKEWLRQKTNESRVAKGQEPVSKERWEEAWNENKVAATEYMGQERAQQHQVGFEQATDANGQANAKLGGDSVRPGEKHIFVMDGDGEVFAKEENESHAQKDELDRGVHVHHSSFKSGEAVAGAGELVVDDEGFLKEVTDRSGHYRPGEEQTSQTLEHLEQGKGVNLDNTKFTMDRGDRAQDKTTGMAREFLQGKVTQQEIDHRQAKIDAGADISAKPAGQMEQTFKNRHNVADELKEKTQSVRETLDHDANRRATRVRKAGEYLDSGRSYDKIAPAAREHAAKDAANLNSAFEESLHESMGQQGPAGEEGLEFDDEALDLENDPYSVGKDIGKEQGQGASDNYAEPSADLDDKKPSVRESLGSSLGNRNSQASNGVRLK